MSIGAQIRTAREAKGLSLATIAQRTRVQPRTLAAIELDDLSHLPPRPFGRGFVRAYAEEVDLDPDRTVRDFFSQFPTLDEAPSPPPQRLALGDEPAYQVPSQWLGLVAALTILALVVTAAIVLGRRSPAARDGSVVGTSGTVAASPATKSADKAADIPTPVDHPAAPASTATPTPAAPIVLSFTMNRACWVTASADGKRVVYRTLQAGEQQTIPAQQDVTIRFGDAGAVSWTLNGRQGTPLGGNGAVRDLHITPQNAANIR
jgi:cytoskeletal protein RodZ